MSNISQFLQYYSDITAAILQHFCNVAVLYGLFLYCMGYSLIENMKNDLHLIAVIIDTTLHIRLALELSISPTKYAIKEDRCL